MRILEIASYYPRRIYGDEIYGGVENNLKFCADVLSKAHDVECLVHNFRNETRQYEVEGYRVTVAATLGKFASQPVSPRLLFEIARRRPDVIHLHAPDILSTIAILLFHRRTPVVVTHHLDIVRQRRLKYLVRPLYRMLLGRAVAVIAYTRNYADHSEELRAARAPLSIIPHGTDASQFVISAEEAAAAAADKTARFGDRRVVSFLGRHVPQKGGEYLIRSINELPGVVLMIGGTGPLTERWRRLTTDLGLEDRVIFVGNVKDTSERRKFFAMSDLFVLPSTTRGESFGQVLVEAQLCGTVAITTEIGSGNTEIVRDDETGFVVRPKDPTALATAIATALSDPARLEAIRERADRSARARYTSDVCGALLLDLFARLASQRRT